ncbi:MAG: hypothetical protein ACFBWO_16840 [Paracoccaceae bacterium]
MSAGSERALPREVLADLDAAGVVAGRPLVALDCDEVIVAFAGHLARWLEGVGYEIRLTQYQLEGAIYPSGETRPVPFEGAIRLLDAFFEEETARQEPLDGALEAIARLEEIAQVVVLTNVPRPARAARIDNLARLGLRAPVIANAGGKGAALAWLAAAADGAPAAFVDDSPSQIASAARRAPEVRRIHFRGSPFIRSVLPEAPEAEASPEDWAACEAAVRRALEGG